MGKTVMAAVAAAMLMAAGTATAEAGCYRLGLTGYHWYRYCIGPRFMYPHHRTCHWRGGRRVCWTY